MADKTGISWTDATWNPVRGCSRISEGCRNCYAEQQAARIVRMGKGKPTAYDGLVKQSVSASEAGKPARWTGVVLLVPEHLADPLRWKKPRRIFVSSMSDLFHESLTNEQIAAVFGVMAAAPQHTFQVLTKRAKRMREWFEWRAGGMRADNDIAVQCVNILDDEHPEVMGDRVAIGLTWPLPNVWLGVSVENQDAADERIPELLDTPAAVRFLSCEPLLGPVDLKRWIERTDHCCGCEATNDPQADDRCPECGEEGTLISTWGDDQREIYLAGDRYKAPLRDGCEIHQIIAGCESGPGARPCSVEWLRSLRDQCSIAGVAFFLKQATARIGDMTEADRRVPLDDAYTGASPRVGNLIPVIAAAVGSRRKPGGVIELPYLDGVQHKDFPEVSR